MSKSYIDELVAMSEDALGEEMINIVFDLRAFRERLRNAMEEQSRSARRSCYEDVQSTGQLCHYCKSVVHDIFINATVL
jgi:hypothetical protein